MAEHGILHLLSRLFGAKTEDSPKTKVSYYTEKDEPKPQDLLDTTIYHDGVDLVKNLRPGKVHLHGTISMVSGRYVRTGLHVTEGILSDPTASVRLVWFNHPYQAAAIKPGETYDVVGSYALRRGRFSISNPKVQKLSEGCLNQEEPKPKIIQESSPEPPKHSIWTEHFYGTGVSPDSPWGKLKTKVIIRDNYTCVGCGSHQNLTVDHIKEVSLGGTNAMSNLRTLCKVCHEARHGRKFLERNFTADDNYGTKRNVSKKLLEIQNALEQQNDIQIKYSDASGVQSIRMIRPLKIRRAKWVYVQAFCRLDNDFRVFRLGRLTLLPGYSGVNKYIGDPKLRKEFPPEIIERFNKLFS